MTAVADLASTAKKIARLEGELEEAKADRDHLIAVALEEGASVRQVAKVAGVSKTRVDQIRHGTVAHEKESGTITGTVKVVHHKKEPQTVKVRVVDQDGNPVDPNNPPVSKPRKVEVKVVYPDKK